MSELDNAIRDNQAIIFPVTENERKIGKLNDTNKELKDRIDHLERLILSLAGEKNDKQES